MTRFSCPEHGTPSDEDLLDKAQWVSEILGVNSEFNDYCMREISMASLIAVFAYSEWLSEQAIIHGDPTFLLGIDTMIEDARRLGKLRFAALTLQAKDQPSN